MAVWTPLTAFVILAAVFGFGDFIANKTKGYVSGVIVAALLYLCGYWTGIIPSQAGAAGELSTTGLPALMGAFGIALMITHIGTIIDFSSLIKEWKTVVVALVGLVGIGLICFTVGIWLFGRHYSLAAAPPIAGGLIASIIVSQYSTSAGYPEIGAYAMLVSSFQMFIGIPVASFMLKKVVGQLLGDGIVQEEPKSAASRGLNIRIFPEMPAALRSPNIYLAKLGLVALLALQIGNLTAIPGSNPKNYYLNPNIAYLLFGVLFTELGFLERNSLNKSASFDMLMIGTLALIPGNFAAVTPAKFLAMLTPIAGLLILGAIGIMIFAAVAGRFVGYSVPLSIAVGITAMIGYPGTYIVSHECLKGLDVSEEQKQRLLDHILPKMLVGGFTTVTIASVIFAGIVAPLIFL